MPSRFACLFMVCLLLCRCTAYQYIPSHHYTTLHKKKGELNASVNVFPAGIQAGYSITDQFFTFGTAYTKKRNSKPYASKEGGLYEAYVGSSNEVNLGVGYVHRIDKVMLEIMAGGGTGRMDYKHYVDSDLRYNFTLSTRKNNFFIEPLIGFAINQHVEIGAFARFNSIHYYHISTAASSTNLEDSDIAFIGRPEMNVLFFEPGFFLNAGWPNIKFNLQLGGTDELAGPDIRDRSVVFRSGISFRLLPDSKKK